jgi:two-component SAPR family response regulator
MPEMSGFEVHEHARQVAALKSIPFIYLTAISDREHFRKGMLLGADDYITKPFKKTDLLEAIQMRLRRASVLREEASATTLITITSLGGLNIMFGQDPVSWEARKAAEAFLYLLEAEHAVPSERLKDDLWWDSSAISNIYVLHNRIRKATKAFASLTVEKEMVQLELKHSYIWDAKVFETTATEALKGTDFGHLESTLKAYEGEFLPHFDSPWSDNKRGFLDNLYFELLQKSAALAPSDSAEQHIHRLMEQYIGEEI